MKNTKIKNIKTLVKTKFVSLYDVEYKNKNNDDKHWTVASRKCEKDLREIYLNNKKDSVDAVVICALHKSENKLVLIKQFRVPINDYIYELPAGLIDNNEDIKEAVKRELKEETGIDIISINNVNSKDKLYLSPGMTDESVSFVYCLCDGKLSKEYLEDDEDIEAILVSQKEAYEILNSNETIDIKSYLVLQMFVQLGSKLFD